MENCVMLQVDLLMALIRDSATLAAVKRMIEADSAGNYIQNSLMRTVIGMAADKEAK